MCVGIVHGAGKRVDKSLMFERLVNEQADEIIQWTDKEMIDAINNVTFISTILSQEVSDITKQDIPKI
jgi:acetylglutamate kinase